MVTSYYSPASYATAAPCHPFAWAPAPRRSTHCQPAPFLTAGYDDEEEDYDSFDLYRRQLEQQALARKQYERRQREEALLRRQLALEREAERQRQYAAYQAELEEERERRRRESEAFQQAQWRARQQEALRQQRLRQRALEEQQALKRKQQQQQLQQLVAEASDPEDAELSGDGHPLEPFFEMLFGRSLRQTRKSASEGDSSSPTHLLNHSADDCTPDPRPKQVQVDARSAEKEATVTTAPAQQPTRPAEAEGAAKTTPDKQAEAQANDTAPASVLEEDASSADSENAATVLQRHYRTHLHRRQALMTLATLSSSLDTQRDAFKLPTELTFQPSPPPSRASTPAGNDDDDDPAPAHVTPKLAFSSNNAPFLAYEDFLVGLLSKVDAVSTGGDKSVKKARKELVKRIIDELEVLDAAREQTWAKQQSRAESPAATEEAAAETVSSSEREEEVAIEQALLSKTSDQDATAPATEAPKQPDLDLNQTSVAAAAVDEEAHSDAETDSTLSVEDRDMDVEDVLAAARKLGERVEQMELDENREGFVVV
ncbi:hypothetical protein ACM66B_003846 [Microbotryomycetes sp. NB124-2]